MQPHYIKLDTVQCLVRTVIHKLPPSIGGKHADARTPRYTPAGRGPRARRMISDRARRNFARQAPTGKLRTVERTAAQRDLRPAATDGHREPQRPAAPRTTQRTTNGAAFQRTLGATGAP